jgi:hypothetical protein
VHTHGRLPSIRIAIAIFAALLILFGWLHLLLAMQTTSTNRLIMIKAEELRVQNRDNAAVLRKIAEAESPRSMESRILVAGYEANERIYLHLPQPVAEGPTGSEGQELSSSRATDREVTSASESSSLWQSILGGPSETKIQIQP